MHDSHTAATVTEPEQTKTYPETDPNPSFPELEEKVLAFWKDEDVFRKSVENRPAREGAGQNNEFIFYDGPPFANGLPHYGHLLTGFVKDMVARYQTLQGHRVERRFGWDCHGLPAEMGAEKELQISGRQQITEFGIEKFNAHCRSSVMKFTNEWEDYVTRQARWVDFKNDYKTMDFTFMESVMWAFKQLHEKGLIYQAYRVMPYSWAAETPLSNFETRLDNSYREKVDKSVTVAFRLKERPQGAPEGCDGYYVLAWTTTPWTLPSNLALAVSKEVDYTCTVVDGNCYIHSVNAAPSMHRELVPEGTVLETPHFYLREFTEDDFPLFQALMADEEVNAMLRPVKDEALARELFDGVLTRYRRDGFDKWAVFEKGTDRFVGRAGVNRVDDRKDIDLVEVGYALHKEFWGKGYASEIAGEVYRWYFTQTKGEGVSSLYHPENEASKRIITKYGLTYQDEVHYPFLGDARPRHYITREEYFAKNAIKGEALVGQGYEPLFPYFKDQPNAFRIVDGTEFVVDSDGTGVVHMAPGFGEDDQRVCEAAGISLVCPVDNAGRYTDEIFDLDGLKLRGLNVVAETQKAADEPYNDKQLEKYGLANLRIVDYLKQQGTLVKQDDYPHSYPHCWRTDKPLIYKAVPSWYVKIAEPARPGEKSVRERMVELNQQINWIPGHVKEGLFGKWLEGARDWSISRNRFWGSPIPVWQSDNPDNDELYVFGSVAELEAFFGTEVKDLHRPFIDELTKPDPTNPDYTIRRVEDVFDCWFESGSMPYAQVHYPMERKEWFEDHFPADFIVEYAAQTRGWFYTLMVLGTALFDKPPFKNCICHGVVLDDKGQKLSKRLNNYVDPRELFKTHGADALRWFMMSSPVMRGMEMHIDKEGTFIRDAVRLYVKPIWNAYNFFCLYANADGLQGKLIENSDNLMDRYILSKLRECVENVQSQMDAYDAPAACQSVSQFFEVLNNWYIRRTRDRFWGSERTADKQAAYDTLYTVLHMMSRAVSPLLPLISEAIYQGLQGNEGYAAKDSVHLADWPDVSKLPDDEALVFDMDRIRDACNAALSIRSTQNIRIRQPLAKIRLIGLSDRPLNPECLGLVLDEVNVKEYEAVPPDEIHNYAEYKLQIHFPVAGKRLGAKMKAVAGAARQGDWEQKGGVVTAGGEVLEEGEYAIQLEPKPEYKESVQALGSNDALVWLDIQLTPELEQEGVARDVVRLVQQARKDAGLDVSDRIALTLEASALVSNAIMAYKEYIAEQTLAAVLVCEPVNASDYRSETSLGGEPLVVGISRAAR